MMRVLVFVVLCVGVQSFLDAAWDHDVYTGRHWNDLVTESTSTSSATKGPCFLVLYTPQCEGQIIKKENLIEAQLPPQQYITFGKYDTKTIPKHVWYPLDYTDNITARYRPTECPEYLYFPDNGNLYSPEKYSPQSGLKVLEWIWSKVAHRYVIKNDRSHAINVEIRGHRDTGFPVEAGQEIGFNSYISSVVIVTELSTGSFVHGFILDKTTSILTITSDMSMSLDIEKWYSRTKMYISGKNNRARAWRWSLAMNYLLCFKQPVLLPTLTNVGYKIKQIPKGLFTNVQNYYTDQLRLRKFERLSLEPLINQDSVKPTMVHLDAPISEEIARYVSPLIHDWADRKLELTRMYGIREFHRGSIIRPHVARVGSQVASVMMVIAKELDGEADWDFQVTLYDGTRKSMKLNTGQMVFFESATLIHGFPNPFQGTDYALVFIHYRPVDDWTWDIHPDGHWIMHDGNPQEYVDQLITPKTFMKTTKGRVRDEL